MHRYQPRIHVIEVSSEREVDRRMVYTHAFEETQFVAVTAYQNTDVRHVMATCEIKLFQNYYRSLLQLMNIFQHVQCCQNNFEIILVHK